MANGPHELDRTPIHLGSDAAVAVEGFGFDGPSFGAYIKEHCGDETGRLMMIETMAGDWPTWERHTAGWEIVHVLEGRGDFIQRIDGEEQRIPFSAGSTIINPPGVWHTADVTEPMRAIYITPIPGTENEPR